ncbi:DUF4190 domain-containing protein [Myceligenerans pegani]|uniref:DUF4190 domain-containing protein n=1 Tax=Myceligenerans pegani TaxID=2776917 RepID=A0ABR9MZA5_9MICO|nr:DUF4190 domain-containing protein [Myceligenerans sp. TRM 65318]MBE1876735.1 DUF4190 domain-containing protein [Myceligenerans sp. TRM 65318]MBE3019006.1 DUF4190 domain-containing protein [Myceligenerans sp. TRM 65318]
MSTNEPGAQNPYDPPPSGNEPGRTPGQSGGQPPERPGAGQPGGPTPPGTPQPGQAPPPSPYAAGGVPPSAYPTAEPGTPYQQQYPKNSLGVWSLVLGILSFFLCPVIASIAAIVTGHMSRRATREGQADNGGLGLAGIILGWASLVLSAIAIVIFVVAFNAAVNDPAFQDFLNDPSAWPTIDSDY